MIIINIGKFPRQSNPEALCRRLWILFEEGSAGLIKHRTAKTNIRFHITVDSIPFQLL
jgi:hypothetical protein